MPKPKYSFAPKKERKPYEYKGCGCYTCLNKDYQSLEEKQRTELIFQHPVWLMILCKKCGNKRCPHATNHRLKCTNSNEPGQKGSNYE
jgi:hypothetical protein